MIDNDMELMAEWFAARLIVAGVAFRMLEGSRRRYWSLGRGRIIRRRAARLLELAEGA